MRGCPGSNVVDCSEICRSMRTRCCTRFLNQRRFLYVRQCVGRAELHHFARRLCPRLGFATRRLGLSARRHLRHLLLIEAGVLCAASEAVDLATVAIDLGFGSRDLRCQLIDLASQNVLLIVDFDNALLRDRCAIILDNAVCNIGRDEVRACGRIARDRRKRSQTPALRSQAQPRSDTSAPSC